MHLRMVAHAWILLIVGYFCTVNGNKTVYLVNTIKNHSEDEPNADLKPAASTYYSGWTDPYINNGYEVTGHGILDKNDNAYGAYNHGYNKYEASSYGYTGGYNRHEGNSAYGADNSQYKNSLGHSPPGNKIALSGYSGNGGYGGYGGNGGLGSYSGYNNPHYNGANHLGYGYYKRPGYNGIYISGITPSLVTGYRGYSRK